jgi:4-amino-4-deoxy-L-arabinose transferase-like glycosyltransferase/DNA-binding beta-propeller fold protein YncE
VSNQLDCLEDADATLASKGLSPRRTLTNLAWALLALVLGWLSQQLFQRGALWEGLLLYAVAIPIFGWRLARSSATLPARTSLPCAAEGGNARAGWAEVWRHPGWIVAGVGALLSCAALLFFVQEANSTGWLCYVVSLLLFAHGMWTIHPPGTLQATSTSRSAGSTRWWTRIDPWLIAILALALFFRLFQFSSLPFGTWYDEAVAGLDARRVWQDPTFRPVFWESMNHPAHHLYLFALSLQVFGDNIQALRMVSATFGIGTVLAAYLFGRELRGRRWGLLLAFLVATMRWDVNFSRVAMNSIDVPFFTFLTLFCALRALHGGLRSVRWVAATGLSLGMGLCFYTGFRLFTAVFVGFGLASLWLMHRRPRAAGGLDEPGLTGRLGIADAVPAVALCLVSAWLVAMPVVQFAVFHGDVFWQRTRTVSIFSNRENPSLAMALANSAQKHALMFNYRGDPNGRHNLPGAPTLEQLSGILFVLGLGLALVRHDQASVFFLLLLPAGLAGGILSLDFEAPQSLRSIAAMPAVIYFIALSLDALWLELRWAMRIAQPIPRYGLIPVAIGLGAIAFGNGTTYFIQQANDAATWQSFSVAETLVGKKIAALGSDPIYYFSPLLYNHPSIRFHAPVAPPVEGQPVSERKVMPLPDALPARESADRPVVYFIHPDEAWVVDLARQLYPDARIENLPDDPALPNVVTVVQLEPDMVASVQGLDVRYWPGDDDQAAPTMVGHWPIIDGMWPDDAPLSPPFIGEWNGVLYAPHYGHYRLAVEAPGQVKLTLDGQLFEGEASLDLDSVLAQGNHTLRLWAKGGTGKVQLAWQPPREDGGLPRPDGEGLLTIPSWALYRLPVTGQGLLGKYYANPDLEGPPALERIDPVLNVYFHLTPLPRPYSVEWSGTLEVPYEGVYALGLRAVDSAQLYLDGELLVEAQAPDKYTEEFATLKAGLHDLRITFLDQTGRSRIHLYWTRPNGDREIIPASYLWPSAASAQAAPRPAIEPTPAAELPPIELMWLATWGEPGSGAGQFAEPRDVAVIGDTVFVADAGNRRVQAFGRDGAFRTQWSGGMEPFVEPLALAVDHEDRLLVLDSLKGWIYRFDTTGKPLDRLAGPDSMTYHPRGLAVLPNDTIVVADTGGSRLVLLDAKGTIIGEVGTYGESPGQLNEPTDVVMDAADTYYVLEAYNQRLQRMDRWGASLGIWPIPPSVAYDGPHMAWAPDGSLLITAPEQGAVQRYAPDGRLLGRWERAGQPMQRPVGITVDDRSIVYVTDTLAHQVYLFEIR